VKKFRLIALALLAVAALALPAAAAADDNRGLAVFDGQVQAGQDPVLPEGLMYVDQFDHPCPHASKHQRRQKIIADQDRDRGQNHCFRRRPAHPFRPAGGMEALVAAHEGKDQAETGGLDQTVEYIA